MSLIKNKIEWVKEELTKYPELRDCNERLYYNYLRHINYDVNKSVKEFLKDISLNKIPIMDSIGRASRKIQEHNPELRGLNWKNRKKKEEEVRDEIRNI